MTHEQLNLFSNATRRATVRQEQLNMDADVLRHWKSRISDYQKQVSLFCHSPVFRIMSSFQRQGMLSDAAFNDNIFTNLALSSISTQKKAGDPLICKSSSI